jgi:predicted dehydrogenase
MCEKPLAATFEQGKELLELAQAKGLTLCAAPDTFLGAGIQGARRLLEEDVIGTPVGGAAHLIGHGHENWHPDPAFYYEAPGGGPVLDMGPYYVTALVNLLGAVKSVAGMTKTTYPTRTITSEPLKGTVIPAEVPTYQTALLRFASGAIVQLICTFDCYGLPGHNHIEIYGTRGNMTVPNPNNFSGPIQIKIGEKNSPDVTDNWGHGEWIPIDSPYTVDHSRGAGLADMAKALTTGRKPRAGAAQQALHVLEVLTAIHKSSEAGHEIAITTPLDLQPGLPLTAQNGVLD